MSAYFNGVLDRLRSALPPSDPDLFGRQGFAMRLVGILELTANEAPELDEDQFAIVFPDGTHFHLEWLYDQYEQAPAASRDRLLLQLAQHLLASVGGKLSPDWSVARHQLVPRLVPAIHYPLLALQIVVEERPPPVTEFVTRPLSEVLALQLAYDTPRSIGLLSTANLAAWGAQVDDAWEHARKNLSHLARAPFQPVQPGTWVSAAQDAHDATRVLLTDLIAPLDVRGEILALPANRDTLLITGSEDRAGLARLLATGVAATMRAGLLTTRPLVLRNGTWSEWVAPQGHPYADAFREMSIGMVGNWYAHQRSLLASLFEKRGMTRQIALYGKVVHGSDGRVRSATRWEDGPGYLPVVELVAVPAPTGGRLALVPWDRLCEAVGDRLRPAPFGAPPLWEVDGPPPADLWEELSRDVVVTEDEVFS